MPSAPLPPRVRILVACPDLLIRSRIISACQAASVLPEIVNAADLTSAQPGDLAIVDLEAPGVLDAIPAAVGRGARVVGFCGHLDTGLLTAGTVAGAEAMPRGAFLATLPRLVEGAK